MKARLFKIAMKKSIIPIIVGPLLFFVGISALKSGWIGLGIIGCIVLGIASLVFPLFTLISGGYLKDFNAVLAGNGLTMEQVEADLNDAQSFKNMELGRNYALIIDIVPKLVVLRNLVWCYGINKTTNHKLFGVIPWGKSMSYSVKLVNRDRSEIEIRLAKESDSATVLKAIQARVPAVIIGYNDNLANVAKNNFGSMVQHVDQKRMQG